MKFLLASFLSVLPIFTSVAQFNPEAIDIIRPVSESILNSDGVEADFVFVIENKQDGSMESDSGLLQLKGNKFKLSLLGNETYYDGETQWVFMTEEKEVNISTPDLSEEMSLSPQSIFTMYEKGFRFKILSQDGDLSSIEMFPDNRELPFFKVLLVLNTSLNTFVEVVAYGRDGTDTRVIIDEMEKGLNLKDDVFVFNSTTYPDVEIIDMR
jgi:outer membrane lipoprotein-sorting protein